jgi:hypothetical protein
MKSRQDIAVLVPAEMGSDSFAPIGNKQYWPLELMLRIQRTAFVCSNISVFLAPFGFDIFQIN